MEKFIFNVTKIYDILKENLLDFRLTFSNPWVWISSICFFFIFLYRWGLRKLLWFVGILAVLFIARIKIQALLAAKGLIGPESFTLMVENIIFYIVLGIVGVYFFFIKD